MRVKVYKNLHKNCYSVRALEGPCKGLVIYHATSLGLCDVVFKVGEKSRQRVIREGQKNVHAFVEGHLEYINLYSGYTIDYPLYKSLSYTIMRPVSYNPYLHPYFYIKDNKNKIEYTSICIFDQSGLWCT